LGLPLLQPERLRDEAFLNELAAWKADLFVVVAFRMLPQVVWAMPPLGSLNLHASLLPHYRGAAPIHWAVVRGETETGLTTFRIEKELDTGLIYLQERVPIPDDWTTGQLHDELSQRGASLLVDTLTLMTSGQLTPVPQPPAPPDAFYARKITPEDARIDWHRSRESLYHHIRGFSPWPAAWTRLGDQQLKIYRAARAEDLAPLAPPGQFQLSGGRWLVACSDGWLDLLEVQLEGRRRMPAAELMRGLRIDKGQLGEGP
jgi:methionyl-tRNA formyltransferase